MNLMQCQEWINGKIKTGNKYMKTKGSLKANPSLNSYSLSKETQPFKINTSSAGLRRLKVTLTWK